MKIVLMTAISLSLLGAVNLKKDIGDCSKVKDSVKRLQCYDNTASKHKLDIQHSYKPSSNNNQWSVRVDADPLTDDKVVYFSNIAESGRGKYGGEISLFVRCRSNTYKPDVFINWASYLGSEAIVTSRFDKEKLQEKYWSLSTDSKATFYPSSDYNNEQILRKFIKNNNFIAKITPYNESPITVNFDLSGFAKSVKSYYKICNIKSDKEIEKELKVEIQKRKEAEKQAKLEKIRVQEELKNPNSKESQKKKCIDKGYTWQFGDNGTIECGSKIRY